MDGLNVQQQCRAKAAIGIIIYNKWRVAVVMNMLMKNVNSR